MFLKRTLAIIVVICIIMACMPMSVFAIDPVTPAIMQNALAQAIVTYVASHGASITFDNFGGSNAWADGIYSLWSQFVDYMDINHNTTIPDFPSLATIKWGTLFAKIRGTVQMVLDSNLVGYFDAFSNWLFGVKANMTKEDELYEFDSINGVYQSIGVYTQYRMSGIYHCTETEYSNLTGEQKFQLGAKVGYVPLDSNRMRYYSVIQVGPETDPQIYTNGYKQAQNDYYRYYPFFCCLESGKKVYYGYATYTISTNTWVYNYANQYKATTSIYPNPPGEHYYYYVTDSFNTILRPLYDDDYNSENIVETTLLDCQESAYDVFFGQLNNSVNTIEIVPYVGDANPTGQVYIPDNEDVNYSPIPADIPIDVTWDDTLFGDGTETLTDEQSTAIVNAITQEIVDTGTIELAQDLPIVDPTPNEVYIPFLPVTLPNFNFSLSGIWHYVREWISSLGAWFTMVLTVWSNLPYAMVVPVYATMVVLIVLGVYKRFFM